MTSPPSSQLLTLLAALLLTFFFFFFFTLNCSPHAHVHQNFLPSTPRRLGTFSVPLTGIAGFVGPHCFTALKDSGHGALSLGNFNDYHHPSLPALWSKHRIFIEKGDSEGMNGGKESYKDFPHTHPLGRRLFHKESLTPPLVAVSRASGPVTPTGPSPCTRIPRGKGHC